VAKDDVGSTRNDEVAALLDQATAWARDEPRISGLALVGSWARGTPTADSDVDLVVLTRDATPFTEDRSWIEAAVDEPAPVVRTATFGRLAEVRVRLASGLEVELGFVDPSWAETDPVDPGTAAVVRGGCRALHDPDGHLAELIALVGIGSIPPRRAHDR